MADENNGEISTVAKFLQWVEENRGHDERSMLYRGLADKEWEVEAGSYRRLRNSIISKNPRGIVHQELFAEDNKRLLQKMRMEKYWEGSDLELLAKMQHDGVATCLIDFTIQPLIALWFACQPESGRNKPDKTVATDKENESPSGKIVTINRENYIPVTPENMKEIWSFLSPKNEQPKLWIWEPPGQNNNRIIAQYSVFVFGPPKISISKNDSCIIEEKNKKKILKELQNMGISAGALFRDYAGFVLLNKHDEVYENWPIDGSFYSGLMNQEIGEYKRAVKCYDQVINLNPKYADAYNNRGIVNGKLGRYEEAMEDYDKGIDLDPENAGAYNNRGATKSSLGRNEEAMEDYNKAIDLNPKSANAYNNRGNAKSELGRNEEAMEDYNRAIDLDPEDINAYYNRAVAKSALGRYEEAIEDYNEAIKLLPKDAKIHNNRGAAKSALGRYEEAIEDYDKVIDLDLEDINAYYNRGDAKSALGRYEEAILDYDEAIKYAPEYVNAYNNRGNAKFALGNYEEAILDYDEAIKYVPEYADAYYNRGNTKRKLGNYEEAILDYDEAIKYVPEYADAHYNRCLNKIDVGDMEGALADYRKVEKLAPDDERLVMPEKLKEYLKSKKGE